MGRQGRDLSRILPPRSVEYVATGEIVAKENPSELRKVFIIVTTDVPARGVGVDPKLVLCETKHVRSALVDFLQPHAPEPVTQEVSERGQWREQWPDHASTCLHMLA